MPRPVTCRSTETHSTSDENQAGARKAQTFTGDGPALAGAIAVCCLLVATSAFGERPRLVTVAPPNGTDDTLVLEASLQQCVEANDRCVVQLDKGRYKTSQLVTYGFRGTLRGRGRNLTVIEALPGLSVTGAWPCRPNTTDCRIPSLLQFVNGDIRVTNLSFEVPSVPAMLPWELPGTGLIFTDLVDALRVVGSEETHVSVHQVGFKGRLTDSLFGANLINGMVLGGEFPRNSDPGLDLDEDFYPFRGTLRVVGNTFEDVGGSHYFPNHNGSDIYIAHNRYNNVGYAVELGNVENSTVEVVGNHGTAFYVGVLVYNPWFPPEVPSRFLIHRNIFDVAGPFMFGGIFAADNTEGTRVQDLVISNNAIEVEHESAIIALNTYGSYIANNRLSGAGEAAIYMLGASECRLENNHTPKFDASTAKIILNDSTSRCVVTGHYEEGDVLDLGTDNVVSTW